MRRPVDWIRDQLSPALAVALLALLVALSGSAYAISNLPKNSVGSKEIKNKTIKKRDLSKQVRRLLKKAGRQGPQGLPGASGVTGPIGPTGQNGQQGPAGLIDWDNTYTRIATRIGDGYLTTSCFSGDKVIFGSWYSPEGEFDVHETKIENNGQSWVFYVDAQAYDSQFTYGFVYCYDA
jgi:hypothetical protein